MKRYTRIINERKESAQSYGKGRTAYTMAYNYDLEMTLENYFQSVIKKSWTWQKLTEEEKNRFISLDFDKIKGTAKSRIELFNLVYVAFLKGLGYTPINWREEQKQ